ncbi:hypothetical protein KKF84_05105 [Myxococcota bacterium]|nr:hypothetical protein [Myxococcota bacterium]MBU1534675.1 hypothetical protein [Myxococcota bacterium]
MGNNYFAIDIGSTSIKGCAVEENKGASRMVTSHEVSRPDDPLEFKKALEGLLKMVGANGKDRIVVGLSDMVFVRNLSFPFTDAKKVEPLIQYELADQIPLDADESVIAHSGIERTEKGSRVVAAATSAEQVSSLLSLFREVGSDIYRLVFSPARCAAVVPKILAPVMVADVGGKRTELAVIVDGRLFSARVLNGGIENIVESLAKYSGRNEAEVRQWLEQSGSVSAHHQEEEGFESVIREAVNQQFEDWRRFIIATERLLGSKIETIYVTGKGAAFSGFVPWSTGFFERESKVVVAPCEGANSVNSSLIALALMAGFPRNDIIDFRSGGFARDAAYSLVKHKALSVSLGISLFFVMLVISGILNHKRLEREERDLLGVVGFLSKQVLGKRSYNASSIKRSIKKRKTKSKKGALADNPIPAMSAYVLLSEISKKIPPRKDVGVKKDGDKKSPKDKKPDENKPPKPKPTGPGPLVKGAKPGDKGVEPIALDIEEIRIKTGKIKISGTVERAMDVDALITSLKTIKCIEEIKAGKMKSVGSGENEKKQFSLDITMTCL